MDELEKLYNGLIESGDYTKSFEDFKSKYSTDENITSLYNGLNSTGDYTKSKDEFVNKYFSTPVKKKGDTIETSGVSESVGSLPQTKSASSELPSNQGASINSSTAPTVANLNNGKTNSDIPFFQPIPKELQGDNKENIDLLNELENITLSEDELAGIEEEYNKQKGGDFGFLGNIKKAITSTPAFGIKKNPFFNPNSVTPKSKEELTEKLLNEKRTEFISNLDKGKKEKLTDLVKVKNFRADLKRENLEVELDNIDENLFKIKENVEAIDAEILSIENQKTALKTKVKNEGLTPQDENSYNSLIDAQQKFLKERNNAVEGSESIFTNRIEKINQLEDNIENLGSMEQELDLLKRNYGFFDNVKGRAGIGFADMFANVKYQYDRQILRSKRKNIKNLLEARENLFTKGLNTSAIDKELPAEYRVRTFQYDSEEFDIETENEFNKLLSSNFTNKRIVDEQRDKLRSNISVDDINSFGDVINFTVDGLSDNTATIAQLAIPYFGQSLFLINQQAGSELDLKGENKDKKERLNEIEKIFDNDSGSIVNFSDLGEEERNLLLSEQDRISKSLDNLNDTQIFFASSSMAISELAFSRLFGEAKRIKIGKRILQNAGKEELKREVNRATVNMFKDRLSSLKKGGIAVLKDGAEEGFLDEFLTNFTHNGIRKFYLEDESVGLFDNSIDAIAGGLSVGTVMSASPRIGGSFISHFSDRKKRNAVYSNVKEITELQNQLSTNIDIDADLAGLMQNKINNLISKNKEIIGRTIESFDNLDPIDKERILTISNEMAGLEISFDKLTNKKNKTSSEKTLLSEIGDRMNILNEEKGQILDQPVFESTVSEQTKEFADAIGEQEDISQFVTGATKVKIGNTDVILGEKEGVINIESISTPKNQRGQGSARKAIQEITELADEKGKDLRLNVVPLDNTTTEKGLIKLYEEVGFVKDKDFDKDDGGIMMRKPETTDTDTKKGLDNIDTVIDEAETSIENEAIPKLKESAENLSFDEWKNESKKWDDYTDKLSDKVQSFEKGELGLSKRTPEFLEAKKEFDNAFRQQQKFNKSTPKGFGRRKFQEKIDKANQKKKEQKSTTEFETNLNTYSVEVVNGELQIKSKLGDVKPSVSEIKKITEKYVSETNFDKGKRADFSKKENLSPEQISQVVVEESQNPQEVAQQIISVQDSNQDSEKTLEVSKQGAISQALNGVQINKESFSKVDDANNISSVNPHYFSPLHKTLKGKAGNIDAIRESAQELTGEDISLEDITNFIKEFNNPKDFSQSETSNTSDLEDKFKDLTGLKPTPKNIEKVAGKKTESKQKTEGEEDSEIPFQTESTQTRLAGSELISLIDRLKKTGLANDVKVLSNNQIITLLNKIGVENTQQQNINGFVHDGIVYLNRSKVKKDTPIHEFGHLWNSFAKENHKDVFNKGIEIIKDTEYHEAVKNNPAYKNLNEEAQLEEALAQAIGEKGVKILNESKKTKFASWFKALFTKIAKGLGIRSFNANQLANLTLDKYTNLVSGEILSGKQITNKNKKTEKSRQDTSDITSIEVVMAEAIASQNASKILRQQINNKKAIDKAVKDALVKFIRDQIKSKRFNALKKGEFSKILTAVKTTKTKNDLLKQLKKVDDLLDRLDSEIINDNINNILDRKLTKIESGRQKANLLTEEESIILKTVKSNIKGLQSTKKPTQKKYNAITEKLAKLFDNRDEIQLKTEPSREDVLNEEAINISIDVLMGYRSALNSDTKKFLLSSLEQIESIYNQGRSQLISAKEAKANEYKDYRDELVEDTNPDELVQKKRKEQVDSNREGVKADFARLYFNITKRKLIGSMDRLATVLSRKGAGNRNDSAWVQFTNLLKRAETLKERRIGSLSKSITNIQKRFFGSRYKADKMLNTREKLDIILPDPTLEEGQEPLTTQTDFTYDEMLSVWLNAKNEDNLSGLEANGFTEDVIKKIDDILPESVKEYGKWQVEEFYEDSWEDENEVYKRMNFHTLPKSENYAGKLYRGNVDLDIDTEALNKGKGTLRTTAHGSQKIRTKNSKPIMAVPTTFLMKKHITDTSHYVAFGEIHQTMTKLIADKKLTDAIDVTNPLTGDLAVKFLKFYKESILEKGLHRGYPIVNSIAKNINKATLALKTKIGITQTISILNASVDMPSGLSPNKFLGYYADFPKLIESYKYVVNNSEYIKRRYGKEGFDQAITGLSTLIETPMFSTGNNTVDARRKQIARFYKEALDNAMINVRFGDKVGVMGALPVYNAYYDRYKKRYSEEVAREKAMKQFEDAVDRSQQTISTFGKSELQNDPIGRYFAMFATAPIQNQQNAMYHFNEMRRGIKGKGMKGTYLKNAYGFLNYQFAQPMLYTYIANMMAGSIFKALGAGEEEPDDTDKSMLSAFILGNTTAIPFIGGAMQGTVEKFILGMDKSYGEIVSSALLSNSSEFMKKFYEIADAKSKKEEVAKTEEMIQEVSRLLIGFPTIVSEAIFDWDDIYWNDDVDNWVKFYKALGYSDYTIVKSRRQRKTRVQSDKLKEAEKREWENSIIRWEKQNKQKKTEPLFKLLPEQKKRK